MKWKRKECRQQKIEWINLKHKRSGQVNMVIGMMSVLIVSVVMLACLRVSNFMITGAYVEDALAASNLASALIDIDEFGKSGKILIKDGSKSYDIYQEALGINLQLDEDGRSFYRELLVGSVKVIEYIIYNVVNGEIEIIVFSGDGYAEHIFPGIVGEIYTPDGVLVETTTIYSKISFAVKGFGSQIIYVEKENSVDVKKNDR